MERLIEFPSLSKQLGPRININPSSPICRSLVLDIPINNISFSFLSIDNFSQFQINFISLFQLIILSYLEIDLRNYIFSFNVYPF